MSKWETKGTIKPTKSGKGLTIRIYGQPNDQFYYVDKESLQKVLTNQYIETYLQGSNEPFTPQRRT